MGDDNIDMFIPDIDMGYLVTLDVAYGDRGTAESRGFH
jgi:hypothetical protein